MKSLPLIVLTLSLAFSPTAMSADYRLATVAEGLELPWCVAFLPDGRLLVTERPGRMRQISPDGELGEPMEGIPEVLFRGQGGLFDVAPHPGFAENQLIYLSYAQGKPRANATRIARGRLEGNSLKDLEVIFTARPDKTTPQHYGGKFLFLPDGTILFTTGDGFDHREEAQALGGLLGKTVRINDDGSIPEDNPYVRREDADPAVWTWGHRNPQGLAMDEATGQVFLHEHGPRGGDEINRLRPGRNYGWPVITFGVDYSGARISPYTQMPGMEQPLHYWVPSIAPSGLAVYRGDVFPEWQGDLFVGALVDKEVRRVRLRDDRVVEEEALFGELGERLRDVRVSPEGHLFLVTDEGRVVRVERP
jgi:glucose/arabinose dehydrogenase